MLAPATTSPSGAGLPRHLRRLEAESIAFRDATVKRFGLDLIVHTNQEGLTRGISPIASGSALHTEVMKTEALKQALDKHGFDAALGGARRDEEKSRAKERVFSFRS